MFLVAKEKYKFRVFYFNNFTAAWSSHWFYKQNVIISKTKCFKTTTCNFYEDLTNLSLSKIPLSEIWLMVDQKHHIYLKSNEKPKPICFEQNRLKELTTIFIDTFMGVDLSFCPNLIPSIYFTFSNRSYRGSQTFSVHSGPKKKDSSIGLFSSTRVNLDGETTGSQHFQ